MKPITDMKSFISAFDVHDVWPFEVPAPLSANLSALFLTHNIETKTCRTEIAHRKLKVPTTNSSASSWEAITSTTGSS